MPVGLPVTKNEIDTRAGDLARTFQKAFAQVATLKAYLDRTMDTDLVAMGYEQQDVANLKAGIGELAHLATIWEGSAALAAPKDFRTFVSRLWGLGAF